jgi:pilus assembly protein CpaE
MTEELSPPPDRLPIALVLAEEASIAWLQEATRERLTLLPVSPSENLPKLLTQTGANLLLVEFPAQHAVAERLGKLLEVFPNLQLLALGKTQDQESLLAAVRARVTDYVEIGGNTDELRRAIQRALQREQWLRTQRQQRVIAVAGGVGMGCTTAAVNLAVLYKRWFPQKEVLLLDFGMPSGDALLTAGVAPALCFAEAVANLPRCDQSYLRNGISSTRTRVAILPLFREPSDLRGLRAQDALQLLNILLTLFDIVIADLGGERHSDLGRYLLHQADALLLLSDQSVRGMLAARSILASRPGLPGDANPTHLVVTHFDEALAISPAQIARELNAPLLGKGLLPACRRSLLTALNQGEPIVDSAPRDAYAIQLESLAWQLAKDIWPDASATQQNTKQSRFLPKQLRKRWPW